MLRILPLALLMLTLVSSAVHAAAQRSFLSTAGNDGNAVSNCALTAPCRSFGAAIGVTSPGGELIVLDSGGYGPVTITQGVTIEAPAGVYAGITVMSGTGVLVNAPAGTVRLRGLTINGLGSGSIGIDITAAATVEIARTRVVAMAAQAVRSTAAGSHIVIADVAVADTGSVDTAVSFLGATSVHMEHLHVARSGGQGLLLTEVANASARDSSVIDSGLNTLSNAVLVISTLGATSRVSFDRVNVSGASGNCIASVPNGTVGSVQLLAVARSLITSCSTGIIAYAVGVGVTHVSVSDSVIKGNGGFGLHSEGPNATLSVAGSTIVDNGSFGMQQSIGAVLYSRFDNTIRGNGGQETTLQTSGTITALAPM